MYCDELEGAYAEELAGWAIEELEWTYSEELAG
jgi:hypothetical protein